jgi:hypothetical protein
VPTTCATCEQPLGTVYVTDYSNHHHFHCFLSDLDLEEVTVPSVAEALRQFAHDQATRAIGMVLGR